MSHIARAPKGGIDTLEGHYAGGRFVPFYVPRPLMPQVDEQFYPQLIADAKDYSGVALDVVKIDSVFPHQHIDKLRADHMDMRLRMKPILVSRDSYVLDGNHRWWANVHKGAPWISIIRIGLEFDPAIAWLRDRPYVYEITPNTPERN